MQVNAAFHHVPAYGQIKLERSPARKQRSMKGRASLHWLHTPVQEQYRTYATAVAFLNQHGMLLSEKVKKFSLGVRSK